MKLEDQVISLELAKKLKELGVKQDSLFYLAAYENPLDKVFKESDVPDYDWRCDIYNSHYIKDSDYRYSAFTAAELFEILPPRIDINNKSYRLTNYKSFYVDSNENLKIYDYYCILYSPTDFKVKLYDDYLFSLYPSLYQESDRNLSNACAKILIYLIENKLIEVK